MGSRSRKENPRWRLKKPPYQIEKDDFRVENLVRDFDGWVEAAIYRPIPYDLVSMKMKNKTCPGWWTGMRWEGLRMRKGDEILYWKEVQ